YAPCSTLYMVMSPILFLSSRRRHTRSKRDWSSDVCSSDLTCDKNISKFSLINFTPYMGILQYGMEKYAERPGNRPCNLCVSAPLLKFFLNQIFIFTIKNSIHYFRAGKLYLKDVGVMELNAVEVLYMHFVNGRTHDEAVMYDFWLTQYGTEARNLIESLLNKGIIYGNDDLS